MILIYNKLQIRLQKTWQLLDRSIKKQLVDHSPSRPPSILELLNQTTSFISYEIIRDNAIVKCIWTEINMPSWLLCKFVRFCSNSLIDERGGEKV